MDARTPRNYFQSPQEASKALDLIRERLDALLARIQVLKEEKTRTKAHQEIVVDDLTKLEWQQYRKRSKQSARDAIDQIASGTAEEATNALKESLSDRAFYRAEPYLYDEGKRIERQVFWSDLIGHK